MVGFETTYLTQTLNAPRQPQSEDPPPSFSPLFKNPKEFKKFLKNFPYNASLAALSVPIEGVILRILATHLENSSHLSFSPKKGMWNYVKALYQLPLNKPTSCIKIIQEEGLHLSKGGGSRLIHVMTGQGTRILLMEQIGKGPLELMAVAVLQNFLYPLSVFSNSRQIGKTFRESLKITRNNLTNKIGHGSFYLRNLGAAWSYWPGLLIKDKFSPTYGEYAATGAGAVVSLISATGLNVFFKCYFTPGKASREIRTAMAFRGGPGIMVAMSVRECISTFIFFSSLIKD